MNEVKIIENQSADMLIAQERAAIDSQIATAKTYPRDLMRVKNNSIAIATMDKNTAESCRYVKPQGGKHIVGASVHLARIICQQYGNIRVQQRIREVNNKEIVAEAVCFDLETNYAVSVEARRSILTKEGKRYPDHMINTTSMAALAIAERNAILKIIPKSIIDSVYNAAFALVNGELTDETKLQQAKKKALDYFKSKYGAEEKDVLTALGLKSVNQIDAEQVANMRGFIQALKDNEITADELFGWKKETTKAPNPIVDASKDTDDEPNKLNL